MLYIDIRAFGKLEVLSVYRKILYKSILTESTTTLIAVVDYRHKCKGLSASLCRHPNPRLWAAQTSPFIMNTKQHVDG
jgi:hypothetical protein